jgi:hypothetical protein
MFKSSNGTITYSEDNGIVSFAEDESLLVDNGFQHDVGLDHFSAPPARVGTPIPGSTTYAEDIDDVEDQVDDAPRVNETWEEDRAVDRFMDYIKDSYPNKIPKHDGKSIVGAERAVKWLTNLGKEISEAVRKDESGVLDDGSLEEIRVSVMKDILLLKEHIKKLDKTFKKSLKKKAGLDNDLMKYAEEIEIAYNHEVTSEIKKVAAHPKINLFVSPFERAIAGIIINSVVSGGKPLEEVYDFLKEKYKLTDREELAIMQVIMDSGFPIFKDRGTFSSKKDKSGDKTHGIEFIKNYFS